MDREFATKVSRKDGRKSYLAVAWEVEVLAILDTRGGREEPLSDGLWNVQPESLSPDSAVLANSTLHGPQADTLSWSISSVHGAPIRGP